MRTVLGFLLAPLAPAAVAWLLSLAPSLTGVSLPGSFFALSLLYGYPLAALLGIPFYLVFRKKNWLRFWQVCLAGSVIGSLVPLALLTLVVAYKAAEAGLLGALQTGFQEMGSLIPFGAAVGILCAASFWLLALAQVPKGTSAVTRSAA
jgi:hypothetical protein